MPSAPIKPPAPFTDSGDRLDAVPFPPAVTAVRFSDDSDILRFEPRADDVWPRRDRAGNVIDSWDRFHALAVDQIETAGRNMRSTADVFEIGRIGARSREHLRRPATFWALYWFFFQANTQGSGTQEHFAWKAQHYLRMAQDEFKAAMVRIDYDADGDGAVASGEEQRPMVERLVRGG